MDNLETSGVAAFSVKEKFRTELAGHLLISGIIVLLFIMDIHYSGLWHPDAPSHALNGIFYKDFIQESGFLDPLRYAERYYVQYPNLTVGMYPPVFYLVEALFYSLFGVTPLVAKAAILPFALLAGNVFFLMCRLWFPFWLALCGSVFFVMQPVVLFGEKNVMLELPMLANSMAALYFLYQGTKGKKTALFWAPVFSALAFLTKQNAVFLLAVSFIWIIQGRVWRELKCLHFMWGVFVGIVLLAPWVYVNVTIGHAYMAAFAFEEYPIITNLLHYLYLIHEIVFYPVLLLALLAFVFFKRLKNHDGFFFSIVWTVSVVVFVLLMRYPDVRYAMPVVPPLLILSMLALSELRRVVARQQVSNVIIVLLILSHLAQGAAWASREVAGFDKVAEFVLEDSESVAVFYDGYFDSNFVFNMRVKDPARKMFVFRASKTVFATRMVPELGYRELIREEEKFRDILNRYSIKYIVQEETDSLRTPANNNLRHWVQGNHFELIKTFPMRTCGFNCNPDASLRVYKYLDYEAKPMGIIELDMPMLGRKITVDTTGKKDHRE